MISSTAAIASAPRPGDPAAREELLRRHLPLAHRLARRYWQGSDSYEDLVQVASIGLLKAIDRFDPERGTEFTTFAVPTILGELKRYFRDCGWAVHVSRADKDRALEVTRANGELSLTLGRSATPAELAAATGLTVEEVLDGLATAAAARTTPLDAPASAEDGDSATLGDRLACEDEELARVERRDVVARSLRGLSARELEILYLRFVEDLTQSEIAARIGVSQMHVSRLIRRALARLRTVAEAQDATSARARAA